LSLFAKAEIGVGPSILQFFSISLHKLVADASVRKAVIYAEAIEQTQGNLYAVAWAAPRLFFAGEYTCLEEESGLKKNRQRRFLSKSLML